MKLDSNAAATTRRRHGRVHCEETRCALGTVLDMSVSGMRVLIKGRPRLHLSQTVPMLVEIAGVSLAVRAKVVWMNRVGWRRHVAGIEFVDVSPEVRRHIVELAGTASNREYIRDDLSPASRSA